MQGILEIGLEVLCDAIKRFELQSMLAGKRKLLFNRRPCRHGGICISSVVVSAFDRLVPAKTHSALSCPGVLAFVLLVRYPVTIEKVFVPEGTLDRGMILNTSNLFKLSIHS